MVPKTCSFSPNGEFVRYISRKYPTCFACVFWSDLEHNLSDIQVGYFRCIYRTNYSPNKLEKQGSQNRYFSKRRVARRLEKTILSDI